VDGLTVGAPSNAVFQQGQGAVSADNLNTMLQGCANFAAAAAFPGAVGMSIYVWGFVTSGDGGQGVFVWNTGAGPSDGIDVIQPTGVATGAWVRVGGTAGVVTYSYLVEVPLTGFHITIPNGFSSLILNPAGTLATGTIVMPSQPVDGQVVTINTMQTVTAIGFAAPFPAIMLGVPTTLLQSGPGTSFQYVAPQATWFRFG
jgi:hypothetical protein